MRKNIIMKCGAILLGCTLSLFASAADIVLKSAALQMSIAENGHYRSIRIGQEEVLASDHVPLVVACTQGQVIEPRKAEIKGKTIRLTMSDDNLVTLSYTETPHCLTLTITQVPDSYEALLFGPIKVNIHEVVGDVIGVVQGRHVALGMQALNAKTMSGLPTEYIDVVKKKYDIEGKSAELSVGSLPDYRLAAVDLADGAALQLMCRNRSRLEYRQVQTLDSVMVLPVKGPDASIVGAKIALFGCPSAEALQRIGEIEVEQGLPHPLFDGEWGKTARSAMRSYLITDFTEQNLDEILDKAEIAGFKYVYHPGPFEDWGHFRWNSQFSSTGDEGVKAMMDKAASRGVALGVHTLSNFTTTNDAFVTPTPSDHLLKQGILELTHALDATQEEIVIRHSSLFKVPMTLNAMQIDKELITFGKAEENADGTLILKGCKRGAFGTQAATHAQETPLYKLWDYPYKTLFPDLELQEEFSKRLTELFNKTGLRQISFDGLEGCAYTGHEDYATSHFVEQFYRGVHHNVLNDASRLSHYTWHIHTRMNWGEPWGEAMRTGQVENRIKNQHYFQRNLFPRMLGWFLIRLADRKFECSTLEDLEWALAEAAGFDAGYAMNIGVRTLKRHGQIDRLLASIKHWDLLREKQCFTEEQKERLKDPATEWHLEPLSEQSYALYPLSITKRYRCDLGELQPGQPGGADWSIETPYAGAFAVRLRVEGDGYIENPRFMTEKGVVAFPCQVKDGEYLLFDFDGKATVTDKNYRVLRTVEPEGAAELPLGDSHVAFSCDKEADSAPEVTVRFITRGTPEQIQVK
ncbi:MAG: hypothetical protein ACI30I_01875 [Parabacteroides sp.]